MVTTTSVNLHHVEAVMGTMVSLDLRDVEPRRGRDALGAVVAWLHHVDTTFSTYKPDSEVSRFGRGELRLNELSADVVEVFERCEALHTETNGAFDILAVDAPNGTRLDPSGFVKGWSIERASALLEQYGIHTFCINAGGDIVVRGEPEAGRLWRVGIRHPRLADRSAAVVDLPKDSAIATSATYERGLHIADPHTGRPANSVASVTITGPDLGTVDAYATAVFVMGVDGLRWLAHHHPDYDGFVIAHDDQTFATATFPTATFPIATFPITTFPLA